jgi:anthranilate phosphoribosyltransferase
MRELLSGQRNSALKDVVLLNAAAALAADNGDLASGYVESKKSLESGAALTKLEALINISSELR